MAKFIIEMSADMDSWPMTVIRAGGARGLIAGGQAGWLHRRLDVEITA